MEFWKAEIDSLLTLSKIEDIYKGATASIGTKENKTEFWCNISAPRAHIFLLHERVRSILEFRWVFPNSQICESVKIPSLGIWRIPIQFSESTGDLWFVPFGVESEKFLSSDIEQVSEKTSPPAEQKMSGQQPQPILSNVVFPDTQNSDFDDCEFCCGINFNSFGSLLDSLCGCWKPGCGCDCSCGCGCDCQDCDGGDDGTD